MGDNGLQGGNSYEQKDSSGSAFTTKMTDQQIWDGNGFTYAEGDTESGRGAVKFVQTLGVFGGIEFAPEYAPSGNEILEISYQEHESQWTGSRGGLLFQLASDMCVHPYDSPEIFKYMGDTLPIVLSEPYSTDYSESGVKKTPRAPSAVKKIIREHSESYTVNISAASSSNPIELTSEELTPGNPSSKPFPLKMSQLGDGEYRVSLDGRVIDPVNYTVESPENGARETNINLIAPFTDFNWINDEEEVTVVVGFHWKHSLSVPYGAILDAYASNGSGAVTINDHSGGATTSADADDMIVYSQPIATGTSANQSGNATIELFTTGLNDGKSESTHLDFIKTGDLFLLEFTEDDQFIPAFNLVYPKPVSSNPDDIKAALKQITNKFLVESARGTDLLSDDELTPISTDPTSNKTKPQNWRLRFEYSGDGAYIKVNAATEYQLLDDMTITQGQGRDGAKYPIYREPGELCDVYQEPSIGRGVVTRIQKAKSQFFTRVAKSEDEVSRSYPMSYRMTVTDHGMGLFIFDQASVDQDDDYAWFVVQRHVDQTTGQPEFSGKSPVHCVYSPTKRPVEISDLNTYYSTDDVGDLSKPRNIFDSFGRELETEAPTIFVNRDQSFFNDFVNAIDFTGTYSIPPVVHSGGEEPVRKTELDVGFIGGANVSAADAMDYWAKDEQTDQQEIEYEITLDSTEYGSLVQSLGNAAASTPTTDAEFVIPGGSLVAIAPSTISFSSGDMKVTVRLTRLASQSVPFRAGGQLEITAASLNAAHSAAMTSGGIDPLTTNQFVSIDSVTSTVISTTAGVSGFGPVAELSILGFGALGRSGKYTTIGNTAGTSYQTQTTASTQIGNALPSAFSLNAKAGASWNTNPAQQSGVQLSGNVTFPVSELQPVSNFEDATNQTPGTSTVPQSINDWDDPSYALLDILYNEVSANREKVFESLVVALDGVEILRDPDAYILTYDEWVRNGDPATVQRFIEGLDNAGVKRFGSKFKLPESGTTAANFISSLDASSINETKSNAGTSGVGYDAGFLNDLAAAAAGSGTGASGQDYTSYSIYQTSTNSISLRGKLPGDPIFSDYGTSQLNLTAGPNRYLYDFFNQTLYFRDTPRSGSSFSMKLVNYNSSTPSQTTYIITVPSDRDLPDRNQNSVKTINRFIVRESDVLKPWDYHVSATMHETDSNSIINPQEQLSITQNRDFVFSFPTQLTSQRFYYPRSELDLIAISSADFSTQAGHIEIDKYADSDGNRPNTADLYDTFNPTGEALEVGNYAYHEGPDSRQYIWKRKKRKYEGMMSTEPNGNGMRVFLQVTGSSVRYSDVVEGDMSET